MLAKKSKLQFIDFYVLNFTYKFIDLNKKQNQIVTDIEDIMDKYPIDFDFVFKEQEQDELIALFSKININNGENSLPGYVIFVEGVGILRKSNDWKTKEFQFPSISFVISQLRNHVDYITSNGPFGKYSIPLIDVSDLLKQKYPQKIIAAQSETIPKNKDK